MIAFVYILAKCRINVLKECGKILVLGNDKISFTKKLRAD